MPKLQRMYKTLFLVDKLFTVAGRDIQAIFLNLYKIIIEFCNKRIISNKIFNVNHLDIFLKITQPLYKKYLI